MAGRLRVKSRAGGSSSGQVVGGMRKVLIGTQIMILDVKMRMRLGARDAIRVGR